MKKILLTGLLRLFVASNAGAQTWEEWTQQSQTQKKYLLQQIAGLKVYLRYAKAGYEIANKGINTVRNIKKGDFNLHRDFLGSLKNINPNISRYAKVADIIAYQLHIVKQTKTILHSIRGNKQFTIAELDYCITVFHSLLNECVKTAEELLMIVTEGQLEMKDDERLKRIDRLYADMQGHYSFFQSFSQNVRLLSFQRLAEQHQINRYKLLIGLK